MGNPTLSADPERFFQQRHKISDKDISVELITDTIVVTIVSGAADVGVDLITAYLEGPTSGGGVEKEVEMAKAISKGVYNVRLSSTEGMCSYAQHTHYTACTLIYYDD